MRVLNVEDNGMKHYRIANALRSLNIIICSSFSLTNVEAVIGCVHYSDRTDLEEEFEKLIKLI